MKKNLFLAMAMLFLASLPVVAQDHFKQFKVYYGTMDSDFHRKDELDGAGSMINDNAWELGLKFSRSLFANFRIETGINYSHANVEITPAFTGEPVDSREETLEVLSIPVYANFTFLKFFFVEAGPMLDFQLSDGTYDSQTGIGYGIGLGAKVPIKRFFAYVNPSFKRHAVIAFDKARYQQHLTEVGVQFGIGYQF